MNKRTLGARQEAQAAAYLEGCGMQILERNFRTRTGEIDLIARDGETLVFVEVKYRADSAMGYAAEAVDARKRQRIIRTARYYLTGHGCGADTPCRFDVIGITGEKLEYIRDAFWM